MLTNLISVDVSKIINSYAKAANMASHSITRSGIVRQLPTQTNYAAASKFNVGLQALSTPNFSDQKPEGLTE